METDRTTFLDNIDQARAQLYNMFMQAPIAIAILRGREFVFELVNDRMAECAGRNREELLGRPVFEALPEIRDRGYEELLAACLASGVPYSASEHAVHLFRKGRLETAYVNFTYQPLREQDGTINHVIVTVHEITELIRARDIARTSAVELEEQVRERTYALTRKNEELRRQRDFVETILDSSIDLIAVYDTNMCFLALNKKCEEEFNIREEEVLGKSLFEIFPQSATSKAATDLQTALGGQYVHNEIYRSAVSGLYYENFIIPLRNNDTVYGALVIAHDISSSVEAAEKLRQANIQLEKSNRELEQFAYIASHDLQEPLRKIQTFTELLEQQLDNPATAKKYLDKISSSAWRMSTLIREVLNYSRLTTTSESCEDTDLDQILDSVLADLELSLAQKHALVKRSPLPVVKGIPLQLHQLFLNLITNSLKFSEEPPIICISSRRLPAAGRQDHSILAPSLDYVELVFSDNGIGFDQQYADQIFTIFQRLNSRHLYGGTGIGLALCKKIVENHNGFIIARGEQNRGATFTIYLPAS